ncbi:MAG TPA: STAS domain-containing protein [Chitinophagaceae bacterium]|jgi:anti-anti-sigma factor|nr:STAS domain-containing protein [Chitinophagaceae bacterium]
MKVKTDTKEKFHAITVETDLLSANMAAELSTQVLPILQASNRNVVMNMSEVRAIDDSAAEQLVKLQQAFYEKEASFVFCELTPEVEAFLDATDLLEIINVTPTESEAWDIVQMEEIERELLGDDPADENTA